jgi:hypothetical protein
MYGWKSGGLLMGESAMGGILLMSMFLLYVTN